MTDLCITVSLISPVTLLLGLGLYGYIRVIQGEDLG